MSQRQVYQDFKRRLEKRFYRIEDAFRRSSNLTELRDNLLTDSQRVARRKRRDEEQEQEFLRWYRRQATKTGLDPNPDHPEHRYDYRAAWRAGAQPRIDRRDGKYHWPSQFKDPDHPNRFVSGEDTITGEKVHRLAPDRSPASQPKPSVEGTAK